MPNIEVAGIVRIAVSHAKGIVDILEVALKVTRLHHTVSGINSTRYSKIRKNTFFGTDRRL